MTVLPAVVHEVELLKAVYSGKVEINYFLDEESSDDTLRFLMSYLGGTEQASAPSKQDQLVDTMLFSSMGQKDS